MKKELSMKFNKTECVLGVRENGKRIGLLATGELTLGDQIYQAISGPWKKGVLPNGNYAVKKYAVVASSSQAGYKSRTGKGWFIPIREPPGVDRYGFGIHPDGSVEGTAGCIGLVGDDADAFWAAWEKLSMEARPGTMEVTGATEAAKVDQTPKSRTIKGEGRRE